METVNKEVVKEVLEVIAKLLTNTGLNNYCIIASDCAETCYTAYQIDNMDFVDDCFETAEKLEDALLNAPVPTIH